MKIKLLLLNILFFVGLIKTTSAQINIKVKVKSIAVSNTLDCDAGAIDNSDFVFEYKVLDNSPSSFSNNVPVAGSIGMCNYAVVNEHNGPYIFTQASPGSAIFSPTTGVFFDRTYNCKNEIPTALTLTWMAYENDDASAPSVTPIAEGLITSQIISYTVPASNGTYTTQFTQTSSDVACPQTYVIEFEIQKTLGTFSPLSISFLDGNEICTGTLNGDLESAIAGGSGTVLVDWSIDGLGDYNDNLNESGLSGGTYTLVVKDALNCTDTGVVVINEINPPLNLTSFSVSSPTVCAGQLVVDYAVTTQTNVIFFWNFSGGVASINGSGNDINIDFGNNPATGSLSVYAQNSCSTTPTLTMSINIQAAPNVIISGNNSMCDNTQEVLTASGATSYTWNLGANTSSITITPTVTTIYTVTGTDGNGCMAMKEYTMNVLSSPTVQVTGATLAVCPNQSVSLSANGSGALFIWSDGFIGTNHTVNPAATTVYTITNTYTNSCFTQITYTVDVLQGPNLAITGNTLVCDKSFSNLMVSGANSYTWNSGATTPTVSFIVIASMSVSVIGENTNGCIDSLTQAITMVPTPTVTITGNDTICEGSPANLIANSTGTVTYSWNSGANTASITVNPVGTFTYIVIASNGVCGDTTSHEVFVHLLPTIDFTINSAPLCDNGSVYTLTATPSGGIYLGAGVTGNTFNPTVGVGTYPITYSLNVSAACAASQTQTIEVMLCTSINEIENNSLIVFPNPATDYLTVQSDKEIKSVLVYDYLGKLIRMIETTAFETTIDTRDLAKGFYTLTITMNNHSQKTIKVVKQ